MLKEFRDFTMRGNVIDLAVGVIIGSAFGKIVASLIGDIFMPLIGLLIGGIDFSSLAIKVGSAKVMYGSFIQNIIEFVVIAFVVFLMIKAINSAKKPAPAEAPTTKECPYCMSTISINAKRCPHCTSQL